MIIRFTEAMVKYTQIADSSLSLRKLLALLFVSLLLLSSGRARDWIISPETGQDHAGGTAESPLATIQVAISKAAAGDRIILQPRDGIYHQSIDLDGAPQGLVIDGNGVTLDGEGSLEHGVFCTKPIHNVKVFNLQVRHCRSDGFSIQSDSRGIQLFGVHSEKNGGAGFAMGASAEIWISGSAFTENLGLAFQSRDEAQSFLEKCHFQGSGGGVSYEGGRHSLSDCIVGPISAGPALSIQGNPTADGSSSLVIRDLQLAEDGANPARMSIKIGHGASVYYDSPSKSTLSKFDVSVDPTGELRESLYRTFPIGRSDSGSPLMAWAGGGTRQFPSTAYRILHFGKFVPQEIAPKLSPENDWLGLLAPLDTAEFPPQGTAFSPGHSSAHAIWRWIALCAPDAVFVPDTPEGRALGEALREYPPAEVGSVDVFLAGTASDGSPQSQVLSRKDHEMRSAKDEMRARVSRSARELLNQLAANYGDVFDGPYWDALSILARIDGKLTNRAEELAQARLLQAPDLPKNNAEFGGTILYAAIDQDWARQRVMAVADMAFTPDGKPLEAVPFHNEMCEAIFMGCPVLAEAGRISGEKKYFDQSAQNFRFISSRCLRPDGIYRHSPLSEVAWGRGNGFSSLGLALALRHFPAEHPDRAELIEALRSHLSALAEHQDTDGMWHEIIDHADSYAELTATSMIACAIAIAMEEGWLKAEDGWRTRLDAAWASVKMHVSTDGKNLLNACISTGKMRNLEDYYLREAILGPDKRGAAMVMTLATKFLDRQ